VWVSALAGSADAWLLRSDGTFVIATGSTQTSAQPESGASTSPNRIALQGRWRIEAAQPLANGSPARPHVVLIAADAQSQLGRFTIEHQGPRSLTLSDGNALIVLRRPS
jgi:hypothetical protein